MKHERSSCEITATLPLDFYECDGVLPFDSTHGAALAYKEFMQTRHAPGKDDSDDAYDPGAMRLDVLQQLPPYQYAPENPTPRDAAAASFAADQERQGWAHDFEKVGVLGEGGEGRVHLVRQRSLQREVAVKSLHQQQEGEERHQKLLVEALIMGSLEHPNVIPIHALGRDLHNKPFLVMKKVTGDTWKELLRDDQHEAWERLRFWSDERLVRHLEILMEVCNALEHAHSLGILHRDIKPSNVMIGEFGEVYLLDWGVACLRSQAAISDPLAAQIARFSTRPQRRHMLCGTPVYMAPEMFLCDRDLIDRRTDVYLLGATLYEIIYKRPPHKGESLREHMDAALQGPDFGEYDETLHELVEICKQALAPEPDERYPDVGSFRKAIASFLRHRTSALLSQQARHSHQQLEAALETTAKDDLTALHDLFTEARLGYLQAQKTWPGNQRARAGYQRCLEQMIGFYLGHHRLSDAEALLLRLPEARPALDHQLQRLRQERQTQEKQHETIQKLRFELNNSLSHKERMIYVLAIGMPSIVASLFVFFFKRKATILTTTTLLWLSLLVLAIFLVLLVMGRRFWTKNTFDRRFLYFSAIIISAVCLHRWLGYMLGQRPEEIMLVDLCITAVVCITGSLFFRPLLYLGLLSGLLALIAVWYVSRVRDFINVYVFAVFGFLFVLYKRSQQLQAANDDNPATQRSSAPKSE